MEENTNVNVNNDNAVSTAAEQTQAQDEVVFTDAQRDLINKMIQSQSDRRTNQALAKQKKEYEKKLSLSKLDDAERERAEKDDEIATLKQQLADFQIEKNRSELKSVLASRGLSAEFADIISINDDIEASQANIDKLDRLFKAAVKAEVEKRLAGTTPKGNGSSTVEYTKDSAKKMSMAEMEKLAETNPELFSKLFG